MVIAFSPANQSEGAWQLALLFNGSNLISHHPKTRQVCIA